MGIYGVDMGHPFNCGAFGFMSETDGNRAIGKLVISKLKSLGHTVIDCTYDINENELYNRVRLANAQPLDLFLSIHMDSFNNPNSNGVTIYTTENSSAKPIAIRIINEVANSCGYYNRGWKPENFYVLRNTNCPATLIECGFVTNQEDCNKFNAEAIATAIVKGITGQSVQSQSKYSKDFIKSIQHDLQRVSCLGSGEGNATGNETDQVTKDAIKQFRYIVGLKDSDKIDDELVNVLNTITKKPTIGEGWNSPIVAIRFIRWYMGLPKSDVVDAQMTQFITEWQIKNKIWSPSGADGVIRENPDWNKILK